MPYPPWRTRRWLDGVPAGMLLLLGGTALGTFFYGHLVLRFGLSAAYCTVYCTVALLAGMWLLRRQQATTCVACTLRGAERHEEQGGCHAPDRLF